MRRYTLLCTVFILCCLLSLPGTFLGNTYSAESPPLKALSFEAAPEFLDSVLKEGNILSAYTLKSEKGDIEGYDISLDRGTGRIYFFPDRSIFLCEKSSGFSLSLNGFSEITYLSENPSAPVVLTGENGSLIIQTPLGCQSSLFEENNFIMADTSYGLVSPDESKTGFNISFDGELCDWWMYYTPEIVSDISPLLSCSLEKFGADNRMTLDGYYYKSPTLYTPSGEYLFYRIPSPHIAVKFILKPDAGHLRTLGIGMLDIHRKNLNDEGYIPTPSLCNWLYEDYGVGHGFYDTRFNTDFARAMLLSGVDELKEAAERYADYFISYAENHSYETERGILVEDYSHPLGNDKTNASLNHNAAEILFLLDTEKEEAKLVAEKMLRGIEDTADSWIMEDKNLNYAIYPDKSFGGQDYIYLTYNDLLALDRKIGGNEYLQKLMASKREYLEKNWYYEYDK